MVIDESLYLKSKVLIPNRTKDYEDHLRRIIMVNNRLELLKKERDEFTNKINYLDKEIELEKRLYNERKDNEIEEENKLTGAIRTVVSIINNEKVIGRDRLEEIANFKGISLSDLKASIPKELHCKIVNYHPKFSNNDRVIY